MKARKTFKEKKPGLIVVWSIAAILILVVVIKQHTVIKASRTLQSETASEIAAPGTVIAEGGLDPGGTSPFLPIAGYALVVLPGKAMVQLDEYKFNRLNSKIGTIFPDMGRLDLNNAAQYVRITPVKESIVYRVVKL